MKRLQLLAALVGLACLASGAAAHPGRFSVGVSIGGPAYPYYYRPWPYYYYPPPPVVIAPSPVYIQPSPVYVPASPAVVTAPSPQPVVATPAPANTYDSARPATYEAPASMTAGVDAHLAN